MARISEIHYSDAVEANSGTSEFVEVALGAGEDPNDFLISLYEDDGTVGLQVNLNDMERVAYGVALDTDS